MPIRKYHVERRIRTMKELKGIIATLDLDEGIRIILNVPELSSGGFLFLTKSGEKYTINITERVSNEDGMDFFPGGKEEWFFTQDSLEVWRIVEKRMETPIMAWRY